MSEHDKKQLLCSYATPTADTATFTPVTHNIDTATNRSQYVMNLGGFKPTSSLLGRLLEAQGRRVQKNRVGAAISN